MNFFGGGRRQPHAHQQSAELDRDSRKSLMADTDDDGPDEEGGRGGAPVSTIADGSYGATRSKEGAGFSVYSKDRDADEDTVDTGEEGRATSSTACRPVASGLGGGVGYEERGRKRV